MKILRIGFALFLLSLFTASSYAEDLSLEEKEARVAVFINNLADDYPSRNLNGLKEDIVLNNRLIILENGKMSNDTMNSICQLTWLTKLNLLNKSLILPESFGNLVALNELNLSDNQLQSLPASFGSLVNLKKLFLSRNQLQSLPVSFGNLVDLQMLLLGMNNIRNLPASFGNLRNSIRFINLKHNPLEMVSQGICLGEEQLQQIFGDRVMLPRLGRCKFKCVPITEEDLYKKLEAKKIHINRETIKEYRMPEVPDLEWDKDKFMQYWGKLLKLLILVDHEEERIKAIPEDQRIEAEKNYVSQAISYELLANDFKHAYPDLTNEQKIEKHIFPRLNGFIKHMWKLPLEENEENGWQMYKGSVPELKRNLSYIISIMINENLDTNIRHVLMAQLTNALFHCPTGQKEGIDVILLSLLTEYKKSSLTDNIFGLLAREKNILFKSAIMPGDFSQNVHVLSVYFEELKDKLGLTGYFEKFIEKIGAMNNDPFQGSHGNALEAFYLKFNPDYLVKFILDKIENDVYFEIRRTYLNDHFVDQEAQVELKSNIKKIEIERPILIQNIISYLFEKKILTTKNGYESEGWKDYFESDPLGEQYPKVQKDGIQKILIEMNILVSFFDSKES